MENPDRAFQEQFSNVEKNCRLYVGNLDYKTKVNDIRDIFGKYGEIIAIQIKSGFAFIVIIFLFSLRNLENQLKPITPGKS
jgi:RNA recognition motif-containing protein